MLLFTILLLGELLLLYIVHGNKMEEYKKRFCFRIKRNFIYFKS